MADTQTGNMLFLEIQEGKEAMERKRYCDKYPKSVVLTLRRIFARSGTCVHGDSAFASVATCTTLLERTFHILLWSAENC